MPREGCRQRSAIIRDINFADPHRGHIDILASFSLEQHIPLTAAFNRQLRYSHAAWEEIFNVELLNKRLPP